MSDDHDPTDDETPAEPEEVVEPEDAAVEPEPEDAAVEPGPEPEDAEPEDAEPEDAEPEDAEIEDAPESAPPVVAPIIPRRVMATADVLETDHKRLNLDWLVPTIAIVIVVVVLWLTVLWTMAGGNFFGFPSMPEQTSAVTTRTSTPTPTPSATPTPTSAPAPDPTVAAPTFISFGAPTSVACVAPAGDDEVAAVAFSLSWGSVDAESATVAVDGGEPTEAEATGAFSTTFPCPAATATYVVTLEGRGGTASRSVTLSNVGYTG
jgi:hypothetical protein